MKNLFHLPLLFLSIIVLVSCSSESHWVLPDAPLVNPKPPVDNNDDLGEDEDDDHDDNDNDNNDDNDNDNNDNGSATNFYFGFLWGDISSDTYLEMPVDSSATNLFVGRWKNVKFGFDETGNGNLGYTYYGDYDHKNCGLSFLQFNDDGVVFENVYNNMDKVCYLSVYISTWELIEESRLRISNFDDIYIVNVSQSELILKYDWNGTDWGPMQSYYYYERIQPTE